MAQQIVAAGTASFARPLPAAMESASSQVHCTPARLPLIANLSQREAAAYMANRRSYGINTLWINILCNYSNGCNKDATTFDGIAPFTSRGDLSTPNPAYFQRADDMINIANVEHDESNIVARG